MTSRDPLGTTARALVRLITITSRVTLDTTTIVLVGTHQHHKQGYSLHHSSCTGGHAADIRFENDGTNTQLHSAHKDSLHVVVLWRQHTQVHAAPAQFLCSDLLVVRPQFRKRGKRTAPWPTSNLWSRFSKELMYLARQSGCIACPQKLTATPCPGSHLLPSHPCETARSKAQHAGFS